MGTLGNDLGLDEVGDGMTIYQYKGIRPYILVVDGEVHKLKSGDLIEIPKKKLKTRQMRKLFEEVEE